MAEKVIAQLNELLNKEKWTRATLNNYTVANFKELDDLLQQIIDGELEHDALEVCDEHLQHTKNSIVALYVSGILNIRRQTIDDTNLITVVNIFVDNHKWNIVEYLCERILEFGENTYALRTLADCYDNENEPEKMHAVWERLIRVDFEESDIVRLLAEKKEKEGQLEESVEYYKKALHRFINKKAFNAVKELWHKLIQIAPNETEFFHHAEGKIAKTISDERAVQLLEELYPHYKDVSDWDTAIEILKRILRYDSKNPWARKEIVECYQGKFAGHSHLDEYIRVSNLTQSWRNVHDAIADFEKHIAFDAGNFVFHRTWGVGRIKSVKDDKVEIDFARKRGHSMSLKMAVSALDILSKNHIWVLRSTWKKEKLHAKVKKDIAWALQTVIRSFDNAADIKRIKAELVPAVLSPSEWSSWSTKARAILKTDSAFGNLPNKLDSFVVRDQPISYAEKTFNKFKAEKSFFGKVTTLHEFIDQLEADESQDSDLFREMVDFFATQLRAEGEIDEYSVSSLLVLRNVAARFPFLSPGVDLDFRSCFERIDDLEGVFSRIPLPELKKEFIAEVRRNIKSWPTVFVRLFPFFLSREIIYELEKADKTEQLKAIFDAAYSTYRETREPFVWLIRNCSADDEWFKELPIDQEKILICMVHLLDLTYRDIENKKDASFNRKLNRQCHTYLFKDGHLMEFLSNADRDSINRIYTLVNDVRELDPSLLIELKHKVLDRFPDFKFYGEKQTEVVNRGFMATPKSYEDKQKQLQHIHEVEVPANSKEISEALQHGDLRENAEYKAAKERQDMLNSTVARLKEELDRVQVVKKADVDSSRITFGTVISLKNNDTGKTEEFTILGPWESDPDNSVISYLSPLGAELYNKPEGEDVSFVINERQYNYTVEKIEAATF